MLISAIKHSSRFKIGSELKQRIKMKFTSFQLQSLIALIPALTLIPSALGQNIFITAKPRPDGLGVLPGLKAVGDNAVYGELKFSTSGDGKFHYEGPPRTRGDFVGRGGAGEYIKHEGIGGVFSIDFPELQGPVEFAGRGYRTAYCHLEFVDDHKSVTEDTAFYIMADPSFLNPCGERHGVRVVCDDPRATCNYDAWGDILGVVKKPAGSL